ncbi:hypothetical protein YWS52_38670 [Chitiniphilus shinanonensis]
MRIKSGVDAKLKLVSCIERGCCTVRFSDKEAEAIWLSKIKGSAKWMLVYSFPAYGRYIYESTENEIHATLDLRKENEIYVRVDKIENKSTYRALEDPT